MSVEKSGRSDHRIHIDLEIHPGPGLVRVECVESMDEDDNPVQQPGIESGIELCLELSSGDVRARDYEIPSRDRTNSDAAEQEEHLDPDKVGDSASCISCGPRCVSLEACLDALRIAASLDMDDPTDDPTKEAEHEHLQLLPGPFELGVSTEADPDPLRCVPVVTTLHH